MPRNNDDYGWMAIPQMFADTYFKQAQMDFDKWKKEKELAQQGIENQLVIQKMGGVQPRNPEQYMGLMKQGYNEQIIPQLGSYMFPENGGQIPVFTIGESGLRMVGNVAKESKIISPASMITPQQRAEMKPLTEAEQNIITAGSRMRSSLETFRSAVNDGKLDNFLNQVATKQSVPYWVVGNQELQDVKNALDNLKSDIPFLRGGKQLTPLEARRVDILLDPTGKSKKTILANIDKFEKEFGLREFLATQGKRNIKTSEEIQSIMGGTTGQLKSGLKYKVE